MQTVYYLVNIQWLVPNIDEERAAWQQRNLTCAKQMLSFQRERRD